MRIQIRLEKSYDALGGSVTVALRAGVPLRIRVREVELFPDAPQAIPGTSTELTERVVFIDVVPVG